MTAKPISAGWVSVNDMMPPEGATVLVYVHKAANDMHTRVHEIPEMRMGVSMMYEGRLDAYPGEVTHWQLLPPPPGTEL